MPKIQSTILEVEQNPWKTHGHTFTITFDLMPVSGPSAYTTKLKCVAGVIFVQPENQDFLHAKWLYGITPCRVFMLSPLDGKRVREVTHKSISEWDEDKAIVMQLQLIAYDPALFQE